MRNLKEIFYETLIGFEYIMGCKSSKYRKYVKTLIKDDESNENSFPGSWALPLDVVKYIIPLAIGDVFPSCWFDNISRVCRLWCKISIKSIRIIDYRYPYLYDSAKCIAGCEIIARWLTEVNHYNIPNQIEAASVGFGVDPLGFVLVIDKLSTLNTLKSLRVNFLSHNLTKERLTSVFKIVARNKTIRKLDISSNHCDNRLCTVIQSSFMNGITYGLREFHYSNVKMNAFQFNYCLRGLIESPTLVGINFSRNRIDGADIENTLDLLNQSTNLKFIDLSMNRFNFDSTFKILSTCISNKSFKKINITPYVNHKPLYINQDEYQTLQSSIPNLFNEFKNFQIKIIL